ncbi:serine protease inhibitor-like [Paramacrobiotus metropolitanus]|uniref:serine protease inhibitor-like n=1 Tax=Paramacrobiotus metropolitanus TaxID=2943436 RepID=UPI0024463E28|nr:serine protease inhibitor-like [Paramacrobiotus metropolitanus]
MNIAMEMIALLVAGLLVVSAAAQDDADDQCPVMQADTNKCLTNEDIKSAINQFTVQMYQQVTALPGTVPTDNIILLPLHASNALLMACNAASGATQSEIIDSLNLGTGIGCLDAFAIIQDMYRTVPHHSDPPQSDDDMTFNANRAFVDKSVALKPAFTADLLQRFNQTPGVLDFKKNPNAARNEINKWVESKTMGNVKNFLGAGAVTSATQLTAINAHYLQFNWAFPFDAKQTVKGTFTNADGSTSQVDFMKLFTTSLFYFNHQAGQLAPGVPAFQMVRLPSKWGTGVLSVILPSDMKMMPVLERTLTADMLNKAMDTAQRRLVNLTMPKFAIEKAVNLADAVKGLGVIDLFGSGVDLTSMTDQSVRIDGIVHKAMIDVNERGLKAVAASSMAVAARRTIAVGTALDLKVDKPFLFVIRMENLRFLTYIGRVSKLAANALMTSS